MKKTTMIDSVEDIGVYDKRNKLNDLTGKEWLKLTKSFWISEKCKEDKIALNHPAPFMIKDTKKLISFYTKKGMKVLDPFLGSGTTVAAAVTMGRKGYGIDLNPDYIELCKTRFKELKLTEDDYEIILGDSTKKINNYDDEFFDYIVTSPPYHNILKNKSSGIRSDNSSKGYRNGARQGIEYYSDDIRDLGNQETFNDFLKLLTKIMKGCYKKLKTNKYCTIVISDFTVDKKEICVQAYIVNMMEKIGFEFVGNTVLLQNNKPLYPFGYPYAYKINHHHQNMLTFRKICSLSNSAGKIKN